MKIEGSIVVVTGANRGIGKALVQELLAAGVGKVHACARRLASVDGLFADARVQPVELDITDPARVAEVAKLATGANILFNNAGVLDFGAVLDAPAAAFERNMATNFYGLLSMSRAFAPVIEKAGGGALVNILTLVALASMPGLGVYNASKAAAWSLTQSMRAGLASKKIAVHGVFPGAVDTDMLASVEMAKSAPLDVAKAIVAGVAKGTEDIFPDAMSSSLYDAWRKDHKAVERQFSSM